MSREVTIYTKQNCSYCIAAKGLLRKRKVPFREIQLDEKNEAEWRSAFQRSGMKTTPQIFLGEELIGGFKELSIRDSRDKLKSLTSATQTHSAGCACCH